MASSPTENVLEAGQSVMTAVVQIKRAATGKVEEYNLTFTPLPDDQATTDDQTKGAE